MIMKKKAIPNEFFKKISITPTLKTQKIPRLNLF